MQRAIMGILLRGWGGNFLFQSGVFHLLLLQGLISDEILRDLLIFLPEIIGLY